MSANTLRMTILYEPGEDGWLIASVPEVPGTHSQGRTREEARANVLDATSPRSEWQPEAPPDFA